MMHKIIVTGLLLATVCIAGTTSAQPRSAVATVKLQALHGQLQKRGQADQAAAAALAKQLGIPLRRVLPNGKVLELQRVDPHGRPIFYITNNYDAADTVSTDEVWPGGSVGINLTGSGLTIGEWDGGAVDVTHQDLWPRATQMDSPTELSDHSTHVAGTLIGSGASLYLQARGMAYDANLNAYDWNLDTQEMITAALGGLLVSNHSYGIAAGWIALGGTPPDNWWWIGGQGNNEDPNFGYYDTQAQLWDQIAFDAPYYLIVKAAGNDRWDLGPDPGEEYSIVDQDGGLITTSNINPPPADGGSSGYDTLPTASVAKNILTVGAVDDVNGGYSPLSGPSAVQMTGFSSWGPADDGRIKPDLVANGWLLFSTTANNPYFALSAGTSMAAPNVSGSLLLLQEHHMDLNAGQPMRAATLKALAIHTADETGPAPGPDYQHGWGLLNTANAAKLISKEGDGSHWVIEGSLVQGATNSVPINLAEEGARVTATVVWHDPAATPVAPALDPVASMLVNDLDLRIAGGGDTHLPWVLSPTQPASAATSGDNNRDNVEQVEFAGSVGNYTVEVSHKGTLDGGSQDYSLIINLRPPAPVSAGLLIDEDFSEGHPTGWTLHTYQGVSWTFEQNQPGTRYENTTGGNGGFAVLDNGLTNYSLSGLRSFALDLSETESAVLRFKSHTPYLDSFESMHVYASINGGTSWTQLWWENASLLPRFLSLDITNQVAGHANVLLEWRWSSNDNNVGDRWLIDDIEFETYGGSTAEPPPEPSELPAPAFNPSPASGTTNLPLSNSLNWSAGVLADLHHVYLGTSSVMTENDSQGSQAVTGFNPGALAPETTYFWRIDEENASGRTEGQIWSFTTEEGAPPPPTPTLHVGDLDGVSNTAPRNRWTANVTVTVRDEAGQVVPGSLVSGQWSNGTSGSPTCNTLGDGRCTLSKSNLKGGVGSVTLAIVNITHADFDYFPGANVDPDGDSNGTVIVVNKNGTEPTNTPPTVNITAPADGTSYPEDTDLAGASVTLQGNAIDAEDVSFSGPIIWRDNGTQIGTGASITSIFSTGAHTVSASATDSAGDTGSDSITITVQSVGGGSDPQLTSVTNASVSLDSRRWSARAEVLVEDANGPLGGATVTGSWSAGAKGSASCTTAAANGRCQLSKSVKLSVDSVGFSVNGISAGGVDYPANGFITLEPL
ncbi:MAG: S8 family serine peptidase [Halioglobus sp.]